jgi:hypothetical protein
MSLADRWSTLSETYASQHTVDFVALNVALMQNGLALKMPTH